MPAGSGALRAAADQAADRYGVPRPLFRAVIGRESGWRRDARSPAGAVGLVQIHLPSHPDVTEAQALDPGFALDFGAKYLSQLHREFGSWSLALAGYNAGAGAVKRAGGIPAFPETENYVRGVLADAGRVRAPDSSGSPPPAHFRSPALFRQPSPTLPDPTTVALQGLSHLTAGDYSPRVALSSLVPPLTAPEPLTGALTLPAIPEAAPSTPRPSGPPSAAPAAPAATGSPLKTLTASFKHLDVPPGVDVSHVDPELLGAVDRLGAAIGKTITVSSGDRTDDEQTRLWQRYVDSGYDIRYIAAKPGVSNHNYRADRPARAVDLTIDGVPIAKAVPAKTLHAFGLHNPVRGDNPHTTLLTVNG